MKLRQGKKILRSRNVLRNGKENTFSPPHIYCTLLRTLLF